MGGRPFDGACDRQTGHRNRLVAAPPSRGAMARARLALLALLLTVQGAVSQGGGGEETLSGTLNLEAPLLVEEGTTVVLLPGTLLTGSSRVEVRGTLEARGTLESPVRITVPVLVENGTLRLRNASVWSVPGIAILAQGGNVTLADATVYANGAGLDARDANVTLRNVTFREHQGPALLLRGAGAANASGLSFSANAENLVYEPGANGTLRLAGSTLLAPTTRTASLTLRPLLGADETARVTTERNTFGGGDVGIRIAGPGVRLTSVDDAFLGTRVGLALDAGEADLTRATFETQDRAFDAAEGARISLTDPRFAAAVAPVPASAPEASRPAPWWLLLVGLVAAGGTVAWARSRSRAPAPPEAEPPAPAPPPPVVLGPLSEVERRILLDVVANAGSAQAAVAQRLGMTRQALHYHVKKLEARGFLLKEARGRETRCSVPPHVAAALRESVSVTGATHAGAVEKA